jgi:hypothetical protein
MPKRQTAKGLKIPGLHKSLPWLLLAAVCYSFTRMASHDASSAPCYDKGVQQTCKQHVAACEDKSDINYDLQRKLCRNTCNLCDESEAEGGPEKTPPSVPSTRSTGWKVLPGITSAGSKILNTRKTPQKLLRRTRAELGGGDTPSHANEEPCAKYVKQNGVKPGHSWGTLNAKQVHYSHKSSGKI